MVVIFPRGPMEEGGGNFGHMKFLFFFIGFSYSMLGFGLFAIFCHRVGRVCHIVGFFVVTLVHGFAMCLQDRFIYLVCKGRVFGLFYWVNYFFEYSGTYKVGHVCRRLSFNELGDTLFGVGSFFYAKETWGERVCIVGHLSVKVGTFSFANCSIFKGGLGGLHYKSEVVNVKVFLWGVVCWRYFGF